MAEHLYPRPPPIGPSSGEARPPDEGLDPRFGLSGGDIYPFDLRIRTMAEVFAWNEMPLGERVAKGMAIGYCQLIGEDIGKAGVEMGH